jgi:benzoate-CoA ligase
MIAFNAADYLLDRLVREGRGDRIAVRCRGESISYAGLHDRVCRAAAGLRALGVRPEERVALVLLDSPEFVTAFLAAMRIGAVPAPLNPLLPGRDLGVIVANARARVAVVSAERAAVALPGLVAGAPELTDVILTGDAAPDVERVWVHRWQDRMLSDGDSGLYATWEDSPGFWLCTSGTTGAPKLAMHRHVDLRDTAEGYAREILRISEDDRCYSVAPLFHAYGLGNALSFPFSVGATAVLEPSRPPAPALVSSVVQAERPTLFFSVPTSYGALLAADLPPDTFRSVRLAVSAGEALPAEFYTRFKSRFGVEILDGIGSTEMTHIFISNRAGQARPGSSGTPVGGYEVRLEDDDGHALPPGSTGHLVVGGASAATGYWCQADSSRRTFRGGWVRTGDMYTSTEDGFYSYLGRSDDMMKVGGEWVSPAEVEAALLEYPGIVEAAVIGEPTEDGLTRPIAYVVLAAGHALDDEAIAGHCRARLAGYKRPRRVIPVPELPKTATGKIQRAELRRAPVAAAGLT